MNICIVCHNLWGEGDSEGNCPRCGGELSEFTESEMLSRLCSQVKMPLHLMEDLLLEGKMVVKYSFDKQTGEFFAERIGSVH